MGFQYGGLVDLYNYGDGTAYPKYEERYYVELSRFTKGSGLKYFAHESNKLLPGRSVFFNIIHRTDEAYDFLGLNGYESVYNKNWTDTKSDSYKSRMFYKNNTSWLRTKIDVLSHINDDWSYLVGLNYFNFKIKSVDIDRMNEGREEDNEFYLPSVSDVPGLWEKYSEWGIIDEDETSGGTYVGLKLGAMYDTRDNWTYASKGVWTEAIFIWMPSFIGSASMGNLHLNFTHRQYFTVVKDKVHFGYRLGYTGNVIGTEKSFALPMMYTVMLKGATTQGLGGSRSLRGVKRNRVVGNGQVFSNAEFRYKFAKFTWMKQRWYLAFTSFVDAGRVLQLLPIDEKMVDFENQYKANNNGNDYWESTGELKTDYFNLGAESFHVSYGIGFKVSLNENFVVGIDYGRTINDQDGDSGIYIGLNYLY